MERLLRILSLALVVMLGGCTAMMESSTYGTGDLYITDNRIKVAEEIKARAEAEKAEAEARKAMWEARLAEAEYYAASGENYNTIVADDYESAYARRLYGFNSPTYRLPSSYYALATSDAMRYATAYDPAYYNIMVSGDQVWVEPKYVTSMFGAWGATNVTFGIYASPWTYGWGVYASPFYYTMWGYPHYSWYDWNWNMCYNPYHWGYYPGYYNPHYGYPHYGYPHHGHNPQPPHYRPNNKPGGGNVGMGSSFAKNERRHSASRYTSPTSNQNYGKNLNGSRVGATIRNSGSTSSGVNHSTVNRGSSTASHSNTRYSTSTSTTTQKRSEQNSNFRSSSSSSSSSRSNSSSSSSSSYRSSSSSTSSSYRSSGSSSSSSRSSGGTTSSRR